MAKICLKPIGSCKICQYYQFSSDKNDFACFSENENDMIPTFEDYKLAIKSGEIELAQNIYASIFKRKG